MESLIFLLEKKVSKKVKSRHCANGSVQREWMCRLLGFPLVQVMMEPLWAGFVQSSTMAAISYGWEGEVGVVGEEGRLESS